MHLESGVLVGLDLEMHTSYSFFPSSHLKKDVDMKFYQKSMDNYKLSCEIEYGTSIEDIAQKYSIDRGHPKITYLIEEEKPLAMAAILLLFIPPFVTFQLTAVCTPLANLIVSGLYIALIGYMDDTAQEFEEIREMLRVPSWYTDCIEGFWID